jgi:hypothetical protein
MVTSLGPASRWGVLTGESGAARRRPGRTDPEAPARTPQTAPCGGRWNQSALRHAVATAGIDDRATNSLNAARPRGARQARPRADGQLPAERCAHRRLIRVHPRSPGGSTTPSSTSPPRKSQSTSPGRLALASGVFHVEHRRIRRPPWRMCDIRRVCARHDAEFNCVRGFAGRQHARRRPIDSRRGTLWPDRPAHAPMNAGNPPSPAPAVPCLRPLQSSPHRRRGLVRSDWRLAFSGSPASRTRIGTTPGACERCRLDPLVVGLTRSWSAHAAGFVRRGLISPCSTWNICAATGAVARMVSSCSARPRPIWVQGSIPGRRHVWEGRSSPGSHTVAAPPARPPDGRAPAGDPGSSAITKPTDARARNALPTARHGDGLPRIPGGQSCGGPEQPPALPAAARSRCCSDLAAGVRDSSAPTSGSDVPRGTPDTGPHPQCGA